VAVESSLRSASRDRSLTSLYRDLGHDIKGSLNALTLNAELLRQTVPADSGNQADAELQQRCVTALCSEMKRLGRSIGALLDKNVLEDDARRRVDVGRLVRALSNLVQARCARQHVALTVDAPDAPVLVDGVSDQLYGVLLGLAVNALDAMPEGGTLHLAAAAEPGTARVTIGDSGGGVLPGWERRMWDLHATTKPGGTGIGLHVARAVVRAHKGSIRYERTPDDTTHFIVELPLAPVGEP
jgi:signal transduction histidine kinase